MTLLLIGFFRVFLIIRQLLTLNSKLDRLPENPLHNRFERLVVPLMEEIVRFLLLCAVFYATGRHSTRSMACLVGIIYAVVKLLWMLWLFSPSDYASHYKKFIRYYDLFIRSNLDLASLQTSCDCLSTICDSTFALDTGSLESNSLDEDSHECTASLVPQSPTSTQSLKTLISDLDSVKSSISVSLKPEFNLESFCPMPMAKSQLLPIDFSQPRQDPHYNVIDRLYTVSPKNTLHLQYENFELPTKLNLNDDAMDHEDPMNAEVAMTDEDIHHFSSNSEALSMQSTHSDKYASTVHSTETHFGGGGGGNIEYKFPNGSKLKLGGGAGFDFRRGSRHSKNLSNKESSQQLAPVSWDYRWYCWLFCLHNHNSPVPPPRRVVNDSIRKKLSNYTLNNESTSLRVCDSYMLFNSCDEPIVCDLEKGFYPSVTQNAQLYYKFNCFANRYLDRWSNRNGDLLCPIDPAFVRFGVPLLEIPSLYIIIYLYNAFLWQVFSTLILALPFHMEHILPGAVAIIFTLAIITKLFSVNYLHLQCSRSYKFSILLEFLINTLLFMSLFIFCITDQLFS